MPGHAIDVWDVATFDDELAVTLRENADLIASYWSESGRLFREREARTRRGPPEENRFGREYQRLTETVGGMMEDRTIRAWHYTRLTDAEVAHILAEGMLPMTLAIIRERLDGAVAEGSFDQATADELYDASPYHRQFDGNRENRTWLAAEPFPVDSSDVDELLARWGGESVAFDHRCGRLSDLLEGTGRPRVLELEVPVASTTRAYEAGCAVIDAYSFTLGCKGASASNGLLGSTALVAKRGPKSSSSQTVARSSEGSPPPNGLAQACTRPRASTLPSSDAAIPTQARAWASPAPSKAAAISSPERPQCSMQ